MARKLNITIEEADRGNVLRVSLEDGKRSQGELEVIEGQQGSTNLRDRTRRRVNEIVSNWYPADRNAPATS